MFWAIVLLIVGMVLLVKGADFFVDGASKIAKAMRIPSLIIGLTLVSMGTSAPELSVSINAVLSGSSDISFGNVVGSNLFNTFLILGCSSFFIALAFDKVMVKFDIPFMVGIYVIMLVFGFVTSPYKLDRVESIILVLLFVSYMVSLFFRAKNSEETEEDETEVVSKKQILYNVVISIIGLAAIIYGGDLVVDKASFIAKKLGMSEALVGLTIVAVGTSLPELVTSVVASIKKERDIAIGNVIGSNIFNILLILGVASTIKPLPISDAAAFGINSTLCDLIILLISGIAVLLISKITKCLKRWQGVLFVLAYVAYLAYIILREFN